MDGPHSAHQPGIDGRAILHPDVFVGETPVAELYGRALRFVLVDQIRHYGQMTVAEMVTVVEDAGFPVRGRLSKVISDALRWEVNAGRVVRVARGRYRYGRPARTTARRIGIFAGYCWAWLIAVRRHKPSSVPAAAPTAAAAAVATGAPPTPPDIRRLRWRPPDDPAREPWRNTAWLWTT